MKKTIMLCVVCFFLCVGFLLPPSALAIDLSNGTSTSQTYMTIVLYQNCNISLESGIVKGGAKVKGVTTSTKCKIELTIQEKNGLFWKEVDSWSKTASGSSLTLTKSVDAESGKTYRAKATITVWTDSSSETVKSVSSTLKVD